MIFIDEPLSPEDRVQMEARCNRVPIVWDTVTTFPDGFVRRTKGNAVMISTPLRDDGPLSSIDHPKE